jgi:hypothetical protein
MSNIISLDAQHQASASAYATKRTALTFLGLTVFLLMADPLMNTYLGPVPVYAVDFLALLTWFYAKRIPQTKRVPLQSFVFLIIASMLTSELLAAARLGTLLQPSYIILRTLLAVSLFFSVTRIIQGKQDLITILKAGLLGAIITAALMITSSLPQTRSYVARYIFSNALLLPSADQVSSTYSSGSEALRGQSLVGVSILSAAFLNSIWPLILLLRTSERLHIVWRFLTAIAIVLIPIGVVLSYSRGAIVGLVLVLVIAIMLNSKKVSQPIVAGVGLMLLAFVWLGWESDTLKFEWLQTKAEDQLADPYDSDDVTQRIYAYSEPFELVRAQPIFLLVGEGFARDKIDGAPASVGTAWHAVFAAATYGYGMLAAFTYVAMLVIAFLMTWKSVWKSQSAFASTFSRALLAGLAGFSMWFLLGLAGVSEPRGAMLLFFVFGLVAVQSNFETAPAPSIAKSNDHVRARLDSPPRAI